MVCVLLDEREKIDKLNPSQERMDDKQRTDTVSLFSLLPQAKKCSVVHGKKEKVNWD